MTYLSNEHMEKLFEDLYDHFVDSFSQILKDKYAFINFLKFAVSTLESRENITDKLFFKKGLTSHGEPRFNNLDLPEPTIMATIFAEEKQTAKQIFLFFNKL